nr:MAG TPA: hypothetical protein [Caudoviricetes sp.]
MLPKTIQITLKGMHYLLYLHASTITSATSPC